MRRIVTVKSSVDVEKQSKKDTKPLPPVDVSSSKAALADLKKREYSDSAALSYAKAARSWCERDSKEWKVWKEVEAFLTERVT